MIKVNLDHALLKEETKSYQNVVSSIHKKLMLHEGLGCEYTGWVDWVHKISEEELQNITECGKYIAEKCDVCIICGVGGSYLGSKAAIEMLKDKYGVTKPEIIFMGHTFSATYTKHVFDYIKDKSVCVNVISKSGSTTETAVAFRLLQQYMEERYKEEASQRIVVTTDEKKGKMREIALAKGYQTFYIPDDIGGRYSVITPVGLLPLAIVGVDIFQIMKGLLQAYEDMNGCDLNNNQAYRYAVARHILQKQGYDVEVLVTYEPCMKMIEEWWKQLFAESEGKDGKGIFPCSASFSTDLHSVGQFIQEGKKVLFETVLYVENLKEDISIPECKDNYDGLNYLAEKTLNWINQKSYEGTLKAHEETGNVPNIILTLNGITPYSFGYLCYFFFRACAMSCYLLEVNPFNQPGVEVYKRNMFALLGKI